MNTVTGNLIADSRAMHLAHVATQPSLWQRLVKQFDVGQLGNRWNARQQANALRRQAQYMPAADWRLAADMRAAADMHEQRSDR